MRKRKTKRQSLPKKIAKTLDIPEDILFNSPRMIMTSNNDLRIENYKSILEYETEKITLMTKEFIMEICGKDLNITIITDEEISITGVILSLNFTVCGVD